jgi:hypothetical protein
MCKYPQSPLTLCYNCVEGLAGQATVRVKLYSGFNNCLQALRPALTVCNSSTILVASMSSPGYSQPMSMLLSPKLLTSETADDAKAERLKQYMPE